MLSKYPSQKTNHSLSLYHIIIYLYCIITLTTIILIAITITLIINIAIFYIITSTETDNNSIIVIIIDTFTFTLTATLTATVTIYTTITIIIITTNTTSASQETDQNYGPFKTIFRKNLETLTASWIDEINSSYIFPCIVGILVFVGKVASATLPAKGIWVSTLLLGIDLLKLV